MGSFARSHLFFRVEEGEEANLKSFLTQIRNLYSRWFAADWN